MELEYILEKGTADTNEDYLVIRDNIFGVFDGATSLTGQRFARGKTGGQIAAQTAGSVFSTNHYPLTRLARQANREIMSQMVRNRVDISKKENLWSTSAAVVRIDGNRVEWVQTGDAVSILLYADGSHKVLVARKDQDYETLTLFKELVDGRADDKIGAGDDSILADHERALVRQAMGPQIKKVRRQMNVTYGVLNGEPAADDFLNHGVESLDGVTDILLCTDGLSIPSENPGPHKDYAPLVASYRLLGLNRVKELIRQKEKTDSFCLTYPRFKCHDDIAAIAVRI
jgi:serine/threonine protein phosphatase PrpC